MASLSEWLQLMLEEIARKRDAEQGGREEAARRVAEQTADGRCAPPPESAPR
jgi:hypothetical protein